MIDRNSVVVGVPPDMSREQFHDIQDGSPAQHESSAGYNHILAHRVSPAYALAIFRHESRFGTVGLVPDYGLKNPGARRSTVTGKGKVLQIPGRGPFVQYDSWADGWEDFAVAISDPDYVYVQEGRRTIAEIIPRHAPASDNNNPEAFISAVVNSMNEWGATSVPDLTTIIGNRIRAHGIEVHDIRDQMVTNGSYSRLPNTAWEYVAVHYTAVSRGTRGLQGDINSWVGHSRHHVQNNEWPGIAYAIGASQSGRVFLLRDIELKGFHGYLANGNTLAICGDLSNANKPTDAILSSMRVVLNVIHEESPEFVNLKGRTATYGHDELDFIDERNDTECPGPLLPFVQEYRQSPKPGKETTTLKGVDIVLGFRAHFLKVGAAVFPQDPITGGIVVFGYPLRNEYVTEFGSAQPFERMTLTWQRENRPPFDIIGTLKNEHDPPEVL